MGCAQSLIDNEESVTRCKDRRNHIKDAVSSRNAFSASHSAYSLSLKNTGASLSAFSVSHSFPSSSAAPADLSPPPPPPPPRIDTLPHPPSPMPIDGEDGDDKEQDVKLQNNLVMPESKGIVWDYFYMVENMQGSGLGGRAEVENEDEVRYDDNDDDEDNDIMSNGRAGGVMRMRLGGNDAIEMEFKTLEKQKVVLVEDEEDLRAEARAKEQEVEADGGTKAVAATATGQNMAKVMGAIDDHFLKASECAQDVSRMLEASRMHYHSNFANDRGMTA